MNLPVTVILTSAGCHHCRDWRGDGQPRESAHKTRDGPIKGGHQYSPSLFQSLITGNAEGKGVTKWRVIEFYMPTLAPRTPAEALEINEFTLKSGGGIIRTTYSPGAPSGPEGKIRNVMISTNGGAKTPLAGAPDFATWVSQRYPAELTQLAYVYPGWFWINSKTWNDAVQGKGHLYAYTSSHYLTSYIGTDGKYAWRANTDKGLRPTSMMEDPVLNAVKLNNDSPQLRAVIGESTETPPPVLPMPLPPLPSSSGDGRFAEAPAQFMETTGPACTRLGFKLIGEYSS